MCGISWSVDLIRSFQDEPDAAKADMKLRVVADERKSSVGKVRPASEHRVIRAEQRRKSFSETWIVARRWKCTLVDDLDGPK